MVGASKRPLTFLLFATFAILLWRFLVIPALGITLYIDEAQYWTWAQELDWGYFSKPPGVALLIAASTGLFGDGLLGVKALSMLCYPASAWLCWVVAKRLYDEPTAFWSTLIVLTLPIYSWLGLFVSTDALLTLFWMAAVLAYLNVLQENRWGDWLLLGIICGLGLMSKYTMVVWMLAALLHLAIFHRPRLRDLRPWVAAGLALLILAPNLVWNVTHDFPTLRHTADITIGKHAQGGFKSLAEFLAAQWLALGPIFGSVLVVLLFTAHITWKDERHRLLLWFALPLWIVVSAQAFKTSANANWAAPAFAPAAIVVVAWLLQRGLRKTLMAGLIVNLAIAGVTYHWPQLLAVTGHADSRLDPYARARGWDDIGRQLHPLLAAHPGAVIVADNRTVLAHLAYELRANNTPYASWNPEGKQSDHYMLSTHLPLYRGHDLLFVTRDTLPTLPSKVPAEHLTRLSTALPGGRALELEVYLLRDFQGY